MTMKKICTLPIIAALLLCGCSKEMTVIPQADTPSETAAKQTQPAETTETQAQTSAVSETIITADIPIDDDTDVFDDSEFSEVSIGLPYDHPEIESGCVLMVTLSDDCEVMESYPMQISSRYVEYIEVLTYPDE